MEEFTMKKTKQTVCTLLAFLMLLTLTPWGALAATKDATPPFTDIAGHWAADAIAFMFAQGLMRGTSQTTFEPNALFTRAQAATLLYRIADESAVTGASPFDDVAPNTWYSVAITWAYQRNIAQGVGNGHFAPDVPITREQIVTLLYRFATYQGSNVAVPPDFVLDFPDTNRISPWATSAMRWAVYHELVQCMDSGVLCPHGTATRAQAAELLMRFVEKFEYSPLPPLCPELAMRIKQAYLRQWQESGGSQEYTVDDLRITFSVAYSNGVIAEIFRPHPGPPVVISITVNGYRFSFGSGEVTLFFYHTESSDIMRFDVAFERNLISQEELSNLWSHRGFKDD